MVFVARDGIEFDLRGQVRAGVLLIVDVEWRELGVAQIPLCVGLVGTKGEGFSVIAKGEDVLTLMADRDRGTRILAAGQHATGCDVGVLQ